MDLGGPLYEIEATKLHGASVFLDEASVMATENTIMAAVLAKGETVLGNAACEPHVQDLCRFLVSLGAQIEGIESNVLRITRCRRLGQRRLVDRPGPHRGRQLHRHGRDHRRRRHDRGSPARGSRVDHPGVRKARRSRRGGRGHGSRSREAAADRRGRPRRDGSEDRRRPLARVSVGSHLDRGDGRHAGVRHRADVREDVREPPVLHGQARLDGRAHHPLRPASRGRDGTRRPGRPAHGEPRHPRRHGDASRRAVGARDSRRSAPRTRSTRATSASTSGCARSALRSNASTLSSSRVRQLRRRRSRRSRAPPCACRGPKPSPAGWSRPGAR